MFKLNNFSRLSYLSLVALVVLMAAAAPLKLKAQDDLPNDGEGMISPNSGVGTPPVSIDESDSATVNDVEEYDG